MSSKPVQSTCITHSALCKYSHITSSLNIRMVGLTITPFKTKTSDQFNYTGNVQAGQTLLPDVIAPQRLLQLLPNLKTLDLREGVQTDTLFVSNVLTAFTGVTVSY